MLPRPPTSTLFPYTTLFRSIINLGAGTVTLDLNGLNIDGSGTNPTYATGEGAEISTDGTDLYTCLTSGGGSINFADEEDRKSTRLNSSHVEISYAVFCLKKK